VTGLATAGKRPKKAKKWAKRKNILVIAATSAAILILAVAYMLSLANNIENGNEAQAVLIDQLSMTNPNKPFYWTTQTLLNQFNMQVWYKEGTFNTVDFFRDLPRYNFKIIILRVHSAVNPETGNLAIFTGEKWSDSSAQWDYLTDIMNGRIAKVRVEENSTAYFGITQAFIPSMNGDFKGALIIMMGCEGLTNEKMAKAFIEKGAKAYISWTGPVSSEHTDAATLNLLQHLLVDRKTVGESVTATNYEIGRDPDYGSELVWYPLDEEDYVVDIP